MTPEQIAYFAGLLDGEGCIRIGRFHNSGGVLRYRAFIQIAMTDEAPIDWLTSVVGGKKYIDWKRNDIKSKVCYCWQTNAKEGAAILRRALKYLLVKRERADLYIRFSETLCSQGGKGEMRPLSDELLERRKELFEENKRLNSKGKSNANFF